MTTESARSIGDMGANDERMTEYGIPKDGPEGTLEISRWRKPPEQTPMEFAPAGALGFPTPLPGRMFVARTIRWLAPPANFRCPCGTDVRTEANKSSSA